MKQLTLDSLIQAIADVSKHGTNTAVLKTKVDYNIFHKYTIEAYRDPTTLRHLIDKLIPKKSEIAIEAKKTITARSPKEILADIIEMQKDIK